MHPGHIYNDFSDAEKTIKPLGKTRDMSKMLIYFGLLLYVLEVQMPKNYLLTSVFVLNSFFYKNSFDLVFERYGIDVTAYVN